MTGRTSNPMTTRRLWTTLARWLRPATLTPAEIAAIQGIAAAPVTASTPTPRTGRWSTLGRWFQPITLTPEETAAVVGGWYGATRDGA